MLRAKYGYFFVFLVIFPLLALADNYDDGLTALWHKDYVAARQSFSQAAEAGDAGAAYELWHLYQYGQGGARDEKQALQWLLVAAYLKLPAAQMDLAELYSARKDIPHAAEHAVYWWKRVASSTQPLAYYRLGQAYESGQGVKQDFKQAQAYYSQAVNYIEVHAEKGDPEAQFYLASSYERGRGVGQDWNKALAWYKKSGRAGYTPGLTHSGRLLLLQASNETQRQQAAYWLNLAKNQGSELAATLLQGLNDENRQQSKAVVSR